MFCWPFLINCFMFAGKKGSKVKNIMNKYHVDFDGDYYN